MFIVVNNGVVIAGPFKWARKRFEEILLDDLELEVTLPSVMPEGQPYVVNENTKIYSVANGESEPIEPRIQFHNGPFWNFTETHAVKFYKAQNYELETAKGLLKSEVANERWVRENKGTEVTVNGSTLRVGTDKETRNVFQAALNSGLQEMNWKFGSDNWVTLTSSDIQTILAGISAHVQSCFDWEKTTCDQITACTELKQLRDIVVQEPTGNAV